MDKDFYDLLTQYVNGNCTPEEAALMRRWLEEIEDKDLELGEVEKEFLKARMFASIQDGLVDRRKPLQKHPFLRPHFLFRVAASVLALAIFYVWFLRAGDSSEERSPAKALADVVLFENRTESIKVVALPDGSKVELDPSGQLHFSKDLFEDRREVHLTGSAFFDIVKDPGRPFYVYSGKIATRVLGTSFFVDAPANAVKVGVKVITGRVSVFPIEDDDLLKRTKPSKMKNSTSNGVVLSPNQKVEYFIEEGHWVIGLVEEPVPVRSIDEETFSLVFENATIKQVLMSINERYGIEVVTENEKIYDCIFTGDLSKLTLYEMLDAISNSISSTYDIKGTLILISGTGCH